VVVLRRAPAIDYLSFAAKRWVVMVNHLNKNKNTIITVKLESVSPNEKDVLLPNLRFKVLGGKVFESTRENPPGVRLQFA